MVYVPPFEEWLQIYHKHPLTYLAKDKIKTPGRVQIGIPETLKHGWINSSNIRIGQNRPLPHWNRHPSTSHSDG